MKLYSQKTIKQIIDAFGFQFSKSLGQNFLTDYNIVRKIVEVADIENKYVLEIGPGIGTLTDEIRKSAKKVVSVEIDNDLIPILFSNFSGIENVKIIHKDFLKINLEKLCNDEFSGEKFSVVSNLPYNITSPVIEKLLKSNTKIEKMTLMVQKEMAMRMLAKVNEKNYSSLSLLVCFYSKAEMKFKVPNTVFIPKPKVDSAVVTMIPELYDETVNRNLLNDLIRAAFNKRRKTILNSLSDIEEKENLKEIFKSLNLNENLRSENLNIDDYINLANEIEKKRQ